MNFYLCAFEYPYWIKNGHTFFFPPISHWGVNFISDPLPWFRAGSGQLQKWGCTNNGPLKGFGRFVFFLLEHRFLGGSLWGFNYHALREVQVTRRGHVEETRGAITNSPDEFTADTQCQLPACEGVDWCSQSTPRPQTTSHVAEPPSSAHSNAQNPER